MTYSVKFTLQAEEDMARLDKTVAQHIANKIDWLSQSMESIIPAPLKGKFKGKYKLRFGDWKLTGGQTPKLVFHEGKTHPLSPLLIEGRYRR
jgi:hypothetical protein